jgi:phage baseplate assembly protein W
VASEITRISRSFKDISLSFEPHPITKDLPILQNQSAINRSIRNLVETIPTERFFNSTIGSNIRSSMFDIIDFASSSIIEDQIRILISNYEPRVRDTKVQVEPRPDLNEYEVTISYTIVGQEVPTQEYSFILEATR